jgi:hypothetical protein
MLVIATSVMTGVAQRVLMWRAQGLLHLAIRRSVLLKRAGSSGRSRTRCRAHRASAAAGKKFSAATGGAAGRREGVLASQNAPSGGSAHPLDHHFGTKQALPPRAVFSEVTPDRVDELGSLPH